jgi:hypothetical protein
MILDKEKSIKFKFDQRIKVPCARYAIQLWSFYLIFILCNFNLKPSISESTPESADNNTTLVMVYRYGLADSPEILNGLSSSCGRAHFFNELVYFTSIVVDMLRLMIRLAGAFAATRTRTFIKSAANFNTLFATISSSFLCGFCSICKYKLICKIDSVSDKDKPRGIKG